MKNNRSERVINRIVKQFKELRMASGMSHDDLAKMSGVTRPAISHIEGGKRRPSLLLALKISNALGTGLADIVREAEAQEKNK